MFIKNHLTVQNVTYYSKINLKKEESTLIQQINEIKERK